MLAGHYQSMLQGKSVIRELSEFATARGKEIGYENVFDFSVGNPSVPAPEEVKEAITAAGFHILEINHEGEWVNITAVKE